MDYIKIFKILIGNQVTPPGSHFRTKSFKHDSNPSFDI
jgi:hypothetical protein